jgi:phosphonopyruvate decarboxylase
VALSCAALYEALTARGIGFYAGVPDSVLKTFCAYVTDHTRPERHIITANEGGAVALAAGHHLATDEVGLVYLQNSGIGNTINPLTSLADPSVYGIPMLLLIGWRGEPGSADEPQHMAMGRMTPSLLEAIGVPYALLPPEQAEVERVVEMAVTAAQSSLAPYALLVPAGALANYAPRCEPPPTLPLTRERAIELTLDAMPLGALLVSTTGKPSREVFELRRDRGEHHDGDFLSVGAMGHSSQIALGVALGRPERAIWCLDGDGAVLMHLGGLTTIGSLAPANMTHVVLNNGAHDSVGGQPTVGHDIDLCAIASASGYPTVLRADSEVELVARLAALKTAPGPTLLEVRVRKGARIDLGRPTDTPVHSKQRFMRFVRQ